MIEDKEERKKRVSYHSKMKLILFIYLSFFFGADLAHIRTV